MTTTTTHATLTCPACGRVLATVTGAGALDLVPGLTFGHLRYGPDGYHLQCPGCRTWRPTRPDPAPARRPEPGAVA